MSKNPNQPQINDALLGEQSSLASLYQCPVCKIEYTQSEVNRCSTCNWDLTLCSEGFVEKDIMRESVIYQDILQQGRRQEALSFIMRLLDRQLGEINPAMIERVQALSIEQLEDLGIALLDFSQVADLMAWLEQQELSN